MSALAYGTGRNGLSRTLLAALVVALVAASLAGCAAPAVEDEPQSNALPDDAYYVDTTLPDWIDPDTGYDTTREWDLKGGTWPVCMLMSPSQSPQMLVGDREGLYASALEPFGITPVVEKLDLPPRVFEALRRSKWPFVYMPYAVFTDYTRTHDNQGGAGGLQYVAIAGSTQGGGYTLITKDPSIQSVADLAGKTVAGMENNPARIVLVEAAAEKAGLKVGDGEGDIKIVSGESAQDLNDYLAGKYDAVMVLSIVRERFLRTGSHAITDFTDVKYMPNYTILCVERSVLEERPDVVDAFLEAHYQAQQQVEQLPPDELHTLLMDSWNGYFESEETTIAAQRIVPDLTTFRLLLGNMSAEDRIDPSLLMDCFTYMTEHKMWDWGGDVDATRLMDLERYDAVLKRHGEEPQ